MSDDMNNKIQQIAELLGQETMPDNVKGLLSLLAGSLEKKEDEEQVPEAKAEEEPVKEEKPVRADSGFDSDMLDRIKKLAGSKGATANDPRVNLLMAIKPFMNNKRQRKIGNCIQLLQMSGFARLLDNQDK